MPFTPDENNRSLTPTGKVFPSFNAGIGTEMKDPGILSMTPLAASPHQASRAQRVSPAARSKLAEVGSSAGAAGPMARGRR